MQARANIGFGWIFELTIVSEATEDCSGRAEAWRPVCRTVGKAVSSRNSKKIQLPNLRFALLRPVVFASKRDGLNIGLKWLKVTWQSWLRMQPRGSFLPPWNFLGSQCCLRAIQGSRAASHWKTPWRRDDSLDKGRSTMPPAGPWEGLMYTVWLVVALKVCSLCSLSSLARSLFVFYFKLSCTCVRIYIYVYVCAYIYICTQVSMYMYI